GRLLLAPMMDIIHTLNSALRAFHEGDRRAIAMWSLHLLLLTGLLTWMAAQGFSPLWFVLAVSYPALALTKVRSFLEHRAADDPLARSVINEAGLPWRALFLNLNYHAVHHDLPGVPWYALRQLYLHRQAAYLQRNQGFLVRGYGEWRRHFSRRAVAVNAHPGFGEQAQAGGEHG
ncbi:fatty acid desaturase, partial [Klebsiella pneumoniae]